MLAQWQSTGLVNQGSGVRPSHKAESEPPLGWRKVLCLYILIFIILSYFFTSCKCNVFLVVRRNHLFLSSRNQLRNRWQNEFEAAVNAMFFSLYAEIIYFFLLVINSSAPKIFERFFQFVQTLSLSNSLFLRKKRKRIVSCDLENGWRDNLGIPYDLDRFPAFFHCGLAQCRFSLF